MYTSPEKTKYHNIMFDYVNFDEALGGDTHVVRSI